MLPECSLRPCYYTVLPIDSDVIVYYTLSVFGPRCLQWPCSPAWAHRARSYYRRWNWKRMKWKTEVDCDFEASQLISIVFFLSVPAIGQEELDSRTSYASLSYQIELKCAPISWLPDMKTYTHTMHGPPGSMSIPRARSDQMTLRSS